MKDEQIQDWLRLFACLLWPITFILIVYILVRLDYIDTWEE